MTTDTAIAQANELMACPFCGSADVQLGNTHTPSFQVECMACNATAHGQYFPYRGKKEKIKFHYDPELPAVSPFDASELRQMPAAYQKAAASAVAAWNRRNEPPAKSAETLRVVRLAYEAMNYLGDILNGHDMVEPEDEAKTAPAFEAVRAYLAGKPTTPPAAAVACTCPSGDGSLRWPCPQHPLTPSAGVSEAMAVAAIKASKTGWYADETEQMRAALAAAAAAGKGE